MDMDTGKYTRLIKIITKLEENQLLDENNMVAGCQKWDPESETEDELLYFDSPNREEDKQSYVLKQFVTFDQQKDFSETENSSPLIEELKRLEVLEDTDERYTNNRSELFDNFYKKRLIPLTSNTEDIDVSLTQEENNKVEDQADQGTLDMSEEDGHSPVRTLYTAAKNARTPKSSLTNVSDLRAELEKKKEMVIGIHPLLPHLSGMTEDINGKPYHDFTNDWYLSNIKKYENLDDNEIKKFIKRNKARINQELEKFLIDLYKLKKISLISPPLSSEGKAWKKFKRSAAMLKLTKDVGIPYELQIAKLGKHIIYLDPSTYKTQEFKGDTNTDKMSLGDEQQSSITPSVLYGSLGVKGKLSYVADETMMKNISFLVENINNKIHGIFLTCSQEGVIEVIILEKSDQSITLYIFSNDDLNTSISELKKVLSGEKIKCRKITYNILSKDFEIEDEDYEYPPSHTPEYQKVIKNLKSFDDISLLIEHLTIDKDSKLLTGDNNLGTLAQLIVPFNLDDNERKDYNDYDKLTFVTSLKDQDTRKLVCFNHNSNTVTIKDLIESYLSNFNKRYNFKGDFSEFCDEEMKIQKHKFKNADRYERFILGFSKETKEIVIVENPRSDVPSFDEIKIVNEKIKKFLNVFKNVECKDIIKLKQSDNISKDLCNISNLLFKQKVNEIIQYLNGLYETYKLNLTIFNRDLIDKKIKARGAVSDADKYIQDNIEKIVSLNDIAKEYITVLCELRKLEPPSDMDSLFKQINEFNYLNCTGTDQEQINEILNVALGLYDHPTGDQVKAVESNTPNLDMTDTNELEFSDDMVKEKENILFELGIILKNVEADGNCQYRAISYSLHGHEDEHGHIRRQVFEEIRDNPYRYMMSSLSNTSLHDGYRHLKDILKAQLLDMDYDEKLLDDNLLLDVLVINTGDIAKATNDAIEIINKYQQLRDSTGVNKEWGGEETLHAASNALRIKINVIQINGPGHEITPLSGEYDSEIYILYNQGHSHYLGFTYNNDEVAIATLNELKALGFNNFHGIKLSNQKSNNKKRTMHRVAANTGHHAKNAVRSLAAATANTGSRAARSVKQRLSRSNRTASSETTQLMDHEGGSKRKTKTNKKRKTKKKETRKTKRTKRKTKRKSKRKKRTKSK